MNPVSQDLETWYRSAKYPQATVKTPEGKNINLSTILQQLREKEKQEKSDEDIRNEFAKEIRRTHDGTVRALTREAEQLRKEVAQLKDRLIESKEPKRQDQRTITVHPSQPRKLFDVGTILSGLATQHAFSLEQRRSLTAAANIIATNIDDGEHSVPRLKKDGGSEEWTEIARAAVTAVQEIPGRAVRLLEELSTAIEDWNDREESELESG
jgi:uncharacterized protein YdcH (DUF465 family)